MSPALAKKMALMVSWKDNGFSGGVKGAQKGIDGLKAKAKEMVKAFAAGVAGVAALTAALFKLGKSGAYVKSVEESWEGLRKKAGLFPGVLDQISDRIDGTVSRLKLMDSNVRALSGGFDSDKVVEYWDMAKQIADVSSQDVQKVFDSLTLSMNKTEYQTLETIGVVLKAGEVNGAYAESIGKTVNQMTLADRQAAMHLAIVEKYNKDYLSAGDVATRVKVQFDQWAAKTENLKNKFSKIVAESPALGAFMDRLLGGIDKLSQGLDDNAPRIHRFIGGLLSIVDKGAQAVQWLYKMRTVFIAIGAGLVAYKIAGHIKDIGYALKTMQAFQMGATGWIGLIITALVMAVLHYKKLAKWGTYAMEYVAKAGVTAAKYIIKGLRQYLDVYFTVIDAVINGVLKGIKFLMVKLAEAADKIPGFGDKIRDGLLKAADGIGEVDLGSKVAAGMDKAEAKLDETYESLSGWGDKARGAVEGWPDVQEAIKGKILGQAGGAGESTDEMLKKMEGGLKAPEAILTEKAPETVSIDTEKVEDPLANYQEIWEQRQDMAAFYTDSIVDIEQGRHNSYLDLWAKENSDYRKNFEDRQKAFSRGLSAMGSLQDKLYKKNANMGRVINAMMIKGAAEVAASYIESKTAQSRMDALEYTYKAIAAAASGNWGAAGQFGIAAAQAGLVAGVGALAAGAIRNWGANKAEAMTSESAGEDAAVGSEADEEKRGRRKATGTVNTRPMHVYINSTANFQAGYMLFGDTEGAATELYNEHFVDRIQSDIDTGVLNVPKTA